MNPENLLFSFTIFSLLWVCVLCTNTRGKIDAFIKVVFCCEFMRIIQFQCTTYIIYLSNFIGLTNKDDKSNLKSNRYQVQCLEVVYIQATKDLDPCNTATVARQPYAQVLTQLTFETHTFFRVHEFFQYFCGTQVLMPYSVPVLHRYTKLFSWLNSTYLWPARLFRFSPHIYT